MTHKKYRTGRSSEEAIGCGRLASFRDQDPGGNCWDVISQNVKDAWYWILTVGDNHTCTYRHHAPEKMA